MEEEEEPERRRGWIWISLAVLVIILIAVLCFVYLKPLLQPEEEEPVEEVKEEYVPKVLPTYDFYYTQEGNAVNLSITKITEGNVLDTLQVVLSPEYSFTWRNSEEVVIEDKLTLEVKPNRLIGFFGEEYLLIARHKAEREEIFVESIYLEPEKYETSEMPLIQTEAVAGDAVGKIAIFFDSAQMHRREFEGTEPKQEYQFLVLETKVKNTGNIKTEISFEDPYVILKTNKNIYYEAIELPSFEGELLPGEENASRVIFEIPRSQRGSEVYMDVQVQGDGVEFILEVPGAKTSILWPF
ncbi:MAG TPA: DUF4352 domain-containing protein [Thermoplasmata archaeon]|nr:DUF4352 domain-containing protein [Thermoplasmata archaeon]